MVGVDLLGHAEHAVDLLDAEPVEDLVMVNLMLLMGQWYALGEALTSGMRAWKPEQY